MGDDMISHAEEGWGFYVTGKGRGWDVVMGRLAHDINETA